MSAPSIENLVERLTSAPGRAERLTHLEVLPPRIARLAPWPTWVSPSVTDA